MSPFMPGDFFALLPNPGFNAPPYNVSPYMFAAPFEEGKNKNNDKDNQKGEIATKERTKIKGLFLEPRPRTL